MQLTAFTEEDSGAGGDADGCGRLQQSESRFGVIRGAAAGEGAISADGPGGVNVEGTTGRDDASVEGGGPGGQQGDAAGRQSICGIFGGGHGGGITAAAGDE